eukprot:15435006-Alexandrium_andersonii.AAC.1
MAAVKVTTNGGEFPARRVSPSRGGTRHPRATPPRQGTRNAGAKSRSGRRGGGKLEYVEP